MVNIGFPDLGTPVLGYPSYVTAYDGGGHAPASLQFGGIYNAPADWRNFRFEAQGDGTFAIQTVRGYYLGIYSGGLTTDRSVIGPGERFKLIRCDPLY